MNNTTTSLCFVTPAFGTDPKTSFVPLIANELNYREYDVQGVQFRNKESSTAFPVQTLSTTEIQTPYWVGRWLFYRRWKQKIHTYLREHEPDLVIADKECLAPTVIAATDLDIPTIAVVPGLGFTRFNPSPNGSDKSPVFRDLPNSAKVQYPFVHTLFRTHYNALQRASATVTVSDFLTRTIAETFDVSPITIRTPIPVESVRSDTHNRTHITMVNPRTELKGASIAVDLAQQLTEEEFLIAGEFANPENQKTVESLPNVDLLGWVDDMRTVYDKTRILIVPSLVEEGGPRVIGEAFANGIPVVGTDRGGIPEFVGSCGEIVTSPKDISQWKEALDTVDAAYESYAECAANRISLLELDGRLSAFEKVVQQCLQIS